MPEQTFSMIKDWWLFLLTLPPVWYWTIRRIRNPVIREKAFSTRLDACQEKVMVDFKEYQDEEKQSRKDLTTKIEGVHSKIDSLTLELIGKKFE